jgi:hypothetical protein
LKTHYSIVPLFYLTEGAGSFSILFSIDPHGLWDTGGFGRSRPQQIFPGLWQRPLHLKLTPDRQQG